MKLSVIIVSYNVRYFLEKCLVSVYKALEGIDGEVIVIDNHSSDQSVEMVRSGFPKAHVIANTTNTGFAKACNQGLAICRGEYALLLNPDTLVGETTFLKCIEFMDAHPDASACGVRMLDGTGTPLPESMRGLPTPASAFFKMTGISALFPDSAFFNGYYLGGMDRSVIQPVPVLTGAFLFMRMDVIRQIGMLDETFFMYGEDIDLCYRMILAGYQNYYLPEPAIIHYKGESTQRDDLKYVMHFYHAMLIYVRKHIRGLGGGIFRIMIVLGIIIRAVLGALRRLFVKALPVMTDGAVIVGTILLVTKYWARTYFGDIRHFDPAFYRFNLPLYSLLWLVFLYLNGAHDPQRNGKRIFSGMLLGTLAILVIYAILPLQYRSSRAVILIAAALICVVLIPGTLLYKWIKSRFRAPRRIGIVGSRDEVARILEILNRTGESSVVAGWISVNEETTSSDAIGHISGLRDIVRSHRIDELVFSQDLPFGEINAWMSTIGPSVSYRISSAGSSEIVGSDSRRVRGTLYTARVEFALAYPMYRRLKRLIDIGVALILIFLWPFLRLLGKSNSAGWSQTLEVLRGEKTWIGYHRADPLINQLPEIRSGVISLHVQYPSDDLSDVHMINYIYAREYTIWKDLDLIFRNFTGLIRRRDGNAERQDITDG